MNDWVTIAAFQYAHQAAMLKGRLESDGILCNIKDELTATTYVFYGNVIGGVKVQVRENDIKLVIPIMKELGYNIEDDGNYETQVTKVVRFTQKIPIINKLPLEKRYMVLIIAIAIIIGIICTVFYFIMRPTISEQLKDTSWCINEIVYKGKSYQPKSTDQRIVIVPLGGSQCNEQMSFYHDLNLPGINCSSITCNWHVISDSLVLHESDTTHIMRNVAVTWDYMMKTVYHGPFSVKINRRQIVLQSQNTTIYGTKLE